MLSFHSGGRAVVGSGVLGKRKGGVEVDIVTLSVSMISPVSRLLNSLVTVKMSQSSLRRGLGVVSVGRGFGAQGPVGSQHRQPDGHGDQDQEGRGGEGHERCEELSLKEEVGAEQGEEDDGRTAEEDELEHTDDQPGQQQTSRELFFIDILIIYVFIPKTTASSNQEEKV